MLFPFDSMLLQQIQLFSSPALDCIMLALTQLGNPLLWLAAAAIIYWSGRENEAFYLVNVIVFASAITGILKAFFRMPRPSPQQFRVVEEKLHFLPQAGVISHSFPSGHSTTAAAVLAHFYDRIKANIRIIAVALVLGVALSRLYLGQHYLSDVIAGLALGAALGACNRLLIKNVGEHHFRPSKIAEEAGVVAAVLLAIIIVIFFDSLGIAVAVTGFYAGFFILKEKEFRQKKVHGRELFMKGAFGTMGTAILLAPATLTENCALCLPTLFLAGLWISIIFPLLYGKLRPS